MKKNETKNPRKRVKKKTYRRFFYVSFFCSLLLWITLFFSHMIPIHYLILLGILLVLFDLGFFSLMIKKDWKKRAFGTFLTIIKIIGCLLLFLYLLHTLLFLNKVNQGNYNTENYSIITLNTNSYNTLKDIKDKKLGILNSKEEEGLQEAKKHINKKIAIEYISLSDLDTLLEQLLDQQVDAILIEDAQKTLLEEKSNELKNKEKILYTFSVDVLLNDGLTKNVNITKDAFNIFLSGIDSYGKITSVSRSDVNMLVSINPTTHQVLLTSIPRDYYVKLHGINTTLNDKITHAGIHGIDTSIKTVEDLLSIDINYYAKVNFTSLIKIVDELGGIDVDCDEAFKAYYEEDEVVNYSFKKGINHLNGKQALAYARERKSLKDGDIGRVKHQQQLIEALLNKALSKNILVNYNSILNALSDKFVTNMGTENMAKFIRQQIKEMPAWTIEKYTLEGTDAHEYTYSYSTIKSYVMIPKEESVLKAKELIAQVINP